MAAHRLRRRPRRPLWAAGGRLGSQLGRCYHRARGLAAAESSSQLAIRGVWRLESCVSRPAAAGRWPWSALESQAAGCLTAAGLVASGSTAAADSHRVAAGGVALAAVMLSYAAGLSRAEAAAERAAVASLSVRLPGALARHPTPVVKIFSEWLLMLAEERRVESVQATATRPAAAGSSRTLLCCARFNTVQPVKALVVAYCSGLNANLHASRYQ